MKHTIITLFFFVLASQMTFAQSSSKVGMKEEAREKIEALRKAYITDKLNLTDRQASEFWPIYTSYKNEEKNLIGALKKEKKRPQEMTDAEAEAFVEKILDTELKRAELKRKYYTKMKTAIPAKKILRLEHAERKFRSEVMRRMKKNRGKCSDETPSSCEEKSSDK